MELSKSVGTFTPKSFMRSTPGPWLVLLTFASKDGDNLTNLTNKYLTRMEIFFVGIILQINCDNYSSVVGVRLAVNLVFKC
jgi:hypothetical protein